MARYMRTDLGRGHSRLIPPSVIGDGIRFPGLRIKLTAPSEVERRRQNVSYKLSPPTVLEEIVPPFPGLRIKLTTPSEGESRRRRKSTYDLASPIVVEVGGNLGWTAITLAPRPKPKTRSTLRAPAVVFEAVVQVFFGPRVVLSPSFRRPGKALLGRPVVLVAVPPFPGLRIKLIPLSGKPIAKSKLRPPAVVTAAAPVSFGPEANLTYSRRGKASPFLGRPTVISAALGQQGVIGIYLIPSKRGKPKSALKPPIVVTPVAVQVFFGPETALVRSRPRRTQILLIPPAVIGAGVVFPDLRIKLIPLVRRPVAKSELRAPLAAAPAGPPVSFGPEAHLTYSRRGEILSQLAKPIVIEQPQGPHGRAMDVFAPQRRGAPIWILRPPVVVAAAVPLARPLLISLAAQSRRKGISRLEPPRVISAGRVFPGIRRYLVARKTRLVQRPTFYFLTAPVVLGAEEAFFGPEVSLAPSSRGRPQSALSPPAVVAPVLFFGPATELAPQRRGIPKSRLGPPTVVAQAVVIRFETKINLTYSRRGRPTYFLTPPTRVFGFFARKTEISLAAQRRGKAKSILRKPVVVRLAVEIFGPKVTLRPRRVGKAKSKLLPPAVVGRAPFRGLLISLAPSRFPHPKSVLRKPVVVFPFRARPELISLAPQSRGKPKSLLKRPTVVFAPFQARPTQTWFARITPPPTLSKLEPPIVIGAGIAFFGPQVTLVRIKHPPVQHFLRLTLVAFHPPHGDVCGFDIAGTFTCYLEIPGSHVGETQSSGSQVTGSSQAGSKVTGSESAGGSVSGSDRKAT